MEPEAKKPKHKPTALHDAIANINHATFCLHIAGFCGEMEPGLISDYSTTKALLNIFDRNRDAAMIKDDNGYYPLYLVFRYRVPYWQNDFLIYELVTRLLYHYPDAMLQQCYGMECLRILHILQLCIMILILLDLCQRLTYHS